jgi:phage gp29-like protein
LVLPTEFLHAPHRRFASPNESVAHEIWLVTGETNRDLVELVHGEWAISRYRARNPYAGGKMRTGAFWAMVAGWELRDWLTFAEMFGLPLVLGFYQDGAPEKARLALEDAIKAIGADGYAVLSDLVEVVIKDTARSGDSSTLFPKLIEHAEAQMSKAFAGSTTVSDVGGAVGSYNLGSIHESRAYKLSLSDARGVETTTRSDICAPFTIWNGFDRAAPPRLKIQITRDSLERAKTLQIVGTMVPLDSDQIYEEFSLRVPAAGKGVMVPVAKPAVGDK